MGRSPIAAHQPRIAEAGKRTSSQAFKRSSMRQFVALDMSSSIGYYRMYNKQRRKNDQRNNKSRLSSRWREAGRGKENCHQISTGPNPGDAAGTPSLPNHGPEVHRDRIPRHSKPGFQRSSSRLCLELNMLAPSRGHASNHMLPVSSSKPQATKIQASSGKLQACYTKLRASSRKRQAAGCRSLHKVLQSSLFQRKLG